MLSSGHTNYWAEHINQLSAISNFTELQEYIQWNPLPVLTVNIDIVMSEQDKQFLDFITLHYLPADAPGSFAPVNIMEDGNCFPRSISYVLFCTQFHYNEIRT